MPSPRPIERTLVGGCRVGALACTAILVLTSTPRLRAETGYNHAWLRYSPITDQDVRDRYAQLPAMVVALDDSDVVRSAQAELVRGVRGMLGRTLRSDTNVPTESAILLGTIDAVKAALPNVGNLPDLTEDGFWLKTVEINGASHLLITAPNDRGVLYGAFHLLRKIALAEPIASLNEKQTPHAPLRVLNHADNLDGTVDRGYAGRSIFWEAGHVVEDLSRVKDYARLLASVGINVVSINNVRADSRILSDAHLREAARVADAFRPWGVRLLLSVDLDSPQSLGRLRTSDPQSTDVAAFWKLKAEDAYRAIPDLAGFVVLAESGGRLVPMTYGRTHAQAANVVAAALAPHGGVLFYCTSVEDATDQNDPQHDRAMAAYAGFHALDGQFADNVILQTDLGPLEYQVREPPSPLLGQLKQTNQAIALQISQAYDGQQRHLCFLPPAWKEALDFDMQAGGPTPVKQIVAGQAPDRPRGALVAEAGVGRDADWLAHPLAVANLYGFGRLAWNPDLTAKGIAEEWTRLTFNHDPLVVGTIADMLLRSWRIYENYTGPLGAGVPTADGARYGPSIAADADGGSDWQFADKDGIGRDRTAESGTGFIAQYQPPVAEAFESLDSCPDELLLFMHHVPYAHVLKSGKTVVQYMYDAHYQGAREAARQVEKWQLLDGRIDATRYDAVRERLEYQAGHAQVWRDAVCNWLLRTTGIADNEGRVGNHPNRIEAEAMQLDGYEAVDISPWETASGGQAVRCVADGGSGSVRWKFAGKAGWFDVSVWYYDENDGVSRYRLLVAGQVVDQWAADDTLPDGAPNGHTATRHRTSRVTLRPDDELRIEATADAGERAVIDYVEIDPAGA